MAEEINSILYALRLKGVKMTEEKFYDLMYCYENIHQIAFSKRTNDKKAGLIMREMRKITDGSKEKEKKKTQKRN